MLTEQGKEEAADYSRAWWEIFWEEYRHTIVTGVFSIIAGIVDGVAGTLGTLLLLSD